MSCSLGSTTLNVEKTYCSIGNSPAKTCSQCSLFPNISEPLKYFSGHVSNDRCIYQLVKASVSTHPTPLLVIDYVCHSVCEMGFLAMKKLIKLTQGVKARTLGRQNERNFCYDRLALTSIFGLCFMWVCLIKSNCYSLIYSSLNFYHKVLGAYPEHRSYTCYCNLWCC